MSKFAIPVAVAVFLFSLTAVFLGMYLSYSTSEIRLRNLITAKQKDNENELDNMLKKIQQSAQVTSEQARALKEVVSGYAEARSGGGGSLATFVQENIPNLDQSTYTQLMNVVTASRDGFTQRQKEILDLKRAHDDLRTSPISSLFVGGRPEIHVIVVTSQRAQEAFGSGQDNDIQLFSK